MAQALTTSRRSGTAEDYDWQKSQPASCQQRGREQMVLRYGNKSVMSPFSRPAYTLVELLMALAITAMVGAAIAAMLYATNEGTSQRQSMQDLLVQSTTLNVRVGAHVRESKGVLSTGVIEDVDIGPGDDVCTVGFVLLWAKDINNNSTIENNEITAIEQNDCANTIFTYEDSSNTDPFSNATTYRSGRGITLLFLLDDQYSTNLDQGTIPAVLATELQANGITLSGDAALLIEESGRLWRIMDHETCCPIVMRDEKLQVYGTAMKNECWAGSVVEFVPSLAAGDSTPASFVTYRLAAENGGALEASIGAAATRSDPW